VKKRHLASLAEVGAISARMKQIEEELRSSHNTTQDAVEANLAVLRELNEKIHYEDNLDSTTFFDVIFSKKSAYRLSLDKLSADFWKNLRFAVDSVNDNIISHLGQENKCNEEELKFLSLCYFGCSNEVIKLCMDYSNKKTVSNYKNKLIKKITTT
jgi:hypothetical protein